MQEEESAVQSYDLYEHRFEANLRALMNRVTLGPGVTYRLSAQRKHPPVAMAVRGCVTLLFILLSGTYDCVVACFISDGVALQKQILSLFWDVIAGPQQRESLLALALA